MSMEVGLDRVAAMPTVGTGPAPVVCHAFWNKVGITMPNPTRQVMDPAIFDLQRPSSSGRLRRTPQPARNGPASAARGPGCFSVSDDTQLMPLPVH